MAYSKTTWANGTTPAISAANLNKMEQGIYDASVGSNEARQDLGKWYFQKDFSSSKYPFMQFDNLIFSKVYFKLIAPLTATRVFIDGSTNNWQSFTRLYETTKTDFIADVDTSGYTSVKFTVELSISTTDTLEAIIHPYDAYSMSQEIVDLKTDTKALQDFSMNMTVPKDKLSGTNNQGYYFAAYANTGIKSIANNSYNIRSYSVLAGHTYFLYGNNVSINAALPLAVFGTEAVSNNASYKTKLLDGTSTPTDYALRYTPEENGYIHIAWITDKVELGLYDTEFVSDAFIKTIGADINKPIKIQLFGDSITDNTWGDNITWANSIPQMLSECDVTVYDDAVAGACIGHGKASGGGSHSHQEDEYNYVYDLVTDGVTLQTSADFIVILVGTNDWAGGHDLGDMSSTGVTTIYGALREILEYLSTNTTSKVFICTIPQRYNSDDRNRDVNEYGEPINSDRVTLAEYCEPFKKLSAFYGMPCIDLNASLGWNRSNVSNFTTDGLHPNVTGDKMLAALICSEIKKHIG